MQEFVSDAVVLDKEPLGEADSRVSLYTEKCGTVVAKATGGRRITSRLAGHLEPGSVVRVRIVGNRGGQIADALQWSALPRTRESLALLRCAAQLALGGDVDQELWELFMRATRERVGMEDLFRTLGFDPREALCGLCGRKTPEYFDGREARFVCAGCAARNRIAAQLWKW